MSSYPFKKRPLYQGTIWLLACFAMFAAVAIASEYGVDREVACALIVAFALWCGLAHFLRLMIALKIDTAKNVPVIEELKRMSKSDQVFLADIDPSGSGAALNLAVYLASNRGAIPLEVLVDNFLEELDKSWQPSMGSMLMAMQLLPVFGFAFTLKGLRDGLGQGADLETCFGLMLDTSLIGACGSIVCYGLWRIADAACHAHAADLRKLGSQFSEEPVQPEPQLIL